LTETTLYSPASGPSANLHMHKRVCPAVPRPRCGPLVPSPPRYTASTCSPPRSDSHGTTCTRYSLLVRDVKGHSRNQRKMCRLQPKCPSQAATPALPTPPPSTPFDYGGCHYLVVGDRLSGWEEVLSSTAGTNLGGSVGLVQHLRSFFATFGVPEELSSDGGPEFMASHTEDFLRLW
jgi:hypothetical protein